MQIKRQDHKSSKFQKRHDLRFTALSMKDDLPKYLIRETKGILTSSIMATRPYFCFFLPFESQSKQ